MGRRQKFRAVILVGICLVAVALAFLSAAYLIRSQRLSLAWGPIMTITTAHGKLARELDEPVRRGTVVTSGMAVTAFKNQLSFLNSYKVPKDMPEEYAVAFHDYRVACKELTDYLGDHASDPVIGDSSTKIMPFTSFRNDPPPKNFPEPILTRLQAIRNAEGRLHALVQRDGLEPRGTK